MAVRVAHRLIRMHSFIYSAVILQLPAVAAAAGIGGASTGGCRLPPEVQEVLQPCTIERIGERKD